MEWCLSSSMSLLVLSLPDYRSVGPVLCLFLLFLLLVLVLCILLVVDSCGVGVANKFLTVSWPEAAFAI